MYLGCIIVFCNRLSPRKVIECKNDTKWCDSVFILYHNPAGFVAEWERYVVELT